MLRFCTNTPTRLGTAYPHTHTRHTRWTNEARSTLTCIECRSGFIEQQQCWVLDNGSCDCDSLLLTTAQLYTPFPYLGVVPLGKARHKGMGIGHFGSVLSLSTSHVRAAVRNVGQNAPRKQHRILRHNANPPSGGHNNHNR